MFAMILVVSTTLVVLAAISLSGGLREKQTRLEETRFVKNAFDAGVDVVHDMATRGVLRLPQTIEVDVGPVTGLYTVTDVSSGASVSLLGASIGAAPVESLSISGTLTYEGQVYKKQQIIGRGLLSTVWQYAIYDNSGLSTGHHLSTGSAGLLGDVWVNGTIDLSGLANSHIRGDLTSTSSILGLNLTVDGDRISNSDPITFPSVSAAQYQSSATNSLATTTINGYAFPAADASGYPIVYVGSDLSIQGTFSGNGVIFVNGNLTIAGDVSVSASSHLLIIVTGDVAFNARNLGAYLYCGGTLTFPSSGSSRTSTAGIVTANLSLGHGLNASFDPWIRDNPVEAYKMRLPGVWP